MLVVRECISDLIDATNYIMLHALECSVRQVQGSEFDSDKDDRGSFGKDTLRYIKGTTWARRQGLRRLGHSTGLMSANTIREHWWATNRITPLAVRVR